MSPDLGAVYVLMYRRELVCREDLFKRYPTFIINEQSQYIRHTTRFRYGRLYLRCPITLP